MTNRKQILFGITDKDEKTFLSQMCDKADKAILTGARMYTRFLSPAEVYLTESRFSKDTDVFTFGGYDDAERRIVCFSDFDTYETDFDYPIDTVKIFSKNKAVFSHRDYLGSLMALGIKRELVGDIVVCDGYAVLFCHREISDFLTMNLTSIGRNTVSAQLTDISDIQMPQKQFKEKSTTVSSLRLDCILSGATGKSRAIAAELISKGLVQVNYEIAKSSSQTVSDGCVISVRGIGKMIVNTDMSLTKKGRYHINVKQYI